MRGKYYSSRGQWNVDKWEVKSTLVGVKGMVKIRGKYYSSRGHGNGDKGEVNITLVGVRGMVINER